jgi:PrgI family protein
MVTTVRKTHVVPTHLRTPETVLTFGGLSLSARQFLLLLIGAALSYDLWKHLAALTTDPYGGVLAGGVALLPILLASAFAFGRIAGRSLDAWVLAIFRYRSRPKRLVWRSVRFQESGIEESEDLHA